MTPDKQAEREEAYEAGWRTCANWMNRDDLISDVGSPAYVADMQKSLSHLSDAQKDMDPAAAEAPAVTDELLHRLAQQLWEQGHISDLSRITAAIFGRAVLATFAAQPKAGSTEAPEVSDADRFAAFGAGEPVAEGKAAMDAYELVILHANLDEIGAPKDIDGKVLSPWGRVKEHLRVHTTPPSPSLREAESFGSGSTPDAVSVVHSEERDGLTTHAASTYSSNDLIPETPAPPEPSLRDVRDAARYRMIRQHAKFIGDDVFNYEGDEFSKATLVRASEMLDEHIDAALARLEGVE